MDLVARDNKRAAQGSLSGGVVHLGSRSPAVIDLQRADSSGRRRSHREVSADTPPHEVGANGGQAIAISADGRIADDLPSIEVVDVGHLRINGWLTNRRDPNGWRTGYGPRVRKIAEHWKIPLPPIDAP